ncbi:MAG TPA: hypothetical protein PLQ13_12860 [Candidatus Krumholzibacteria bacterium]|nr:hypothetical protein [Candidatus Krumholzibacteria bacterium]
MNRCSAAARLMGCALGLVPLLVLATPSAAATVSLPADAPATRTAALEEVWRLGGDDDGAPLLGVITGGARDAEGNVYLVDRQLSQVLVIAPDGTLAATLGREGDGPGEMRNPHSILLTPDAVGVVQGFPGKVTYLGRDGTPKGELKVGGDAAKGGFNFVRQMAWTSGVLVGAIGRGAFDMEKGTNTTTSSIAILNADGSSKAEIAPNVQSRDFQKFVFDEAADWAEYAAWCATPDGRICSAAGRERWAVNVRDLDGNLVQAWERPFTPRRREAADKEAVGSDMRIVVNGQRMLPEVHALDTDPAIDALYAAGDGRVFVRTCWDVRERLEDGTAGRFDVVAKDGRLLEQLTLTFPDFHPADDALVWLDGQYYLVLKNATDMMRDEDDTDEAKDVADAEPLEVVLVRLPG